MPPPLQRARPGGCHNQPLSVLFLPPGVPSSSSRLAASTSARPAPPQGASLGYCRPGQESLMPPQPGRPQNTGLKYLLVWFSAERPRDSLSSLGPQTSSRCLVSLEKTELPTSLPALRFGGVLPLGSTPTPADQTPSPSSPGSFGIRASLEELSLPTAFPVRKCLADAWNLSFGQSFPTFFSAKGQTRRKDTFRA